MPRRLRPRLTYANVVATIALFLSLGGTSYAVVKLAPGSVQTKHLRVGAVTTDRLAPGAVTRDKLAADVGVRGPRGAVGPQGAVGPRGASNGYEARGRDRNFPTTQNVRVTMAQLRALPAGSYLFNATAHAGVLSIAGSVGICAIVVGGVKLAESALWLGTAAGHVQAGTIAPAGSATLDKPTDATLECWNDHDLPGTGQFIANAILHATRVETLETSYLP